MPRVRDGNIPNPAPKVILPKKLGRKKRKASNPSSPLPQPPPPQASSTPKQPKKRMRTQIFKPIYDKKEVFGILADILERSQHVIRSKKDFERLLLEFEDHYFSYREVNKSLDSLRSHQLYCAGVVWRMMLPIFVAEKGRKVDAVIRFFTRIMLDVGVEEQLVERELPRGELLPLFIHILKVIKQCHCDERAQVRQYIMELLYQILNKFNNNPQFVDDPTLRDDILSDVVKHRVRDKATLVRVQAMLCLKFFLEDANARKTLVFTAYSDPSDEARKAALRVLRSKISMNTTIFTEKIFDISEIVRAEAYEGLSEIPMSKIRSKAQRENILCWGLTQSSPRVKKVVLEKLVPSWLEECNKSIVNLFMKLDLSTKPKTAHLLLDSLYSEPTEEVFESIDLSFISAQKLVPLEEFSVEATLLWLALCSKFKDSRLCLMKLLPEAVDMCNYMEAIIKEIHVEYEQAKFEQREEEYTKLLGLAHILRMIEFLLFEESSRRRIENLLKAILLDHIMDDAIIVTAAVDAIAWLLGPEDDRFEAVLSGIIREVFDGQNESPRSRIDIDNDLVESTNALQLDEDGFPLSQEANLTDSSFVVTPGVTTSKGLVIVTRYLTFLKRISPVVQHLCENRAIQFLEDEDGRVRGYTLAFYSLVGITDRTHARKAFLILLQVRYVKVIAKHSVRVALINANAQGLRCYNLRVLKQHSEALRRDFHEHVQEFGFKSIVDLMLHYRLESFRQTDEIDDICPMPIPFNNPNATNEELQRVMIQVLESYGGPQPSNPALLRRVQGLVKLLIRGRITSINVIMNLFSLWVNPALFGTPIYFLIGNFVHIYSALSLANAERMTSSLLLSLKRDFVNLNDTAEDGQLQSSNKSKLIDLVVANTSQTALKRFPKPHIVHEKFAVQILDDILEDMEPLENVQLAQIIRNLSIEDRRAAAEIKLRCNTIFDILISGQLKNDHLKLAIKVIGRVLYKKFGDLDEEDADSGATVAETASDCDQTINSSEIDVEDPVAEMEELDQNILDEADE